MPDYPVCDLIKRDPIDTYVSPEIMKSFNETFDVLPLYEMKILNFVRVRHYSMINNDSQRCRWSQYKNVYQSRKRIPFEFPKSKDMHFYNNRVRHMPSETTKCRNNDCTRKLTFNYKYDEKGVTPVPVEAQFRLTTISKNKKKLFNTSLFTSEV